uniref:protein-serine/threonine phosphatase n=2 Tax=Anthurium amnicola TaxID=1678845 RepID=A0A1D1ZKU4_9ARAE
MRTVGSHRFFLDPVEKETLVARMAKDGTVVGEMEEGEISSDSVEEISEEDFKQQDCPRRPPGRPGRVWMGDPMQFSVLGRDYASNLYNFAWAQAVQNKPLGSFIFEDATAPAVKPDPAEAPVKREVCNVDDSSEESICRMEKEEGELEEGEIEMGSLEAEVFDEATSNPSQSAGEKVAAGEVAAVPLGAAVTKEAAADLASQEKEIEVTEDFDTQVASVLEVLETITEEDAEKSFEAGCSRLQKTLDKLRQMMSRSQLPVLDALVQQAFMAIHTVHSVYLKRKYQNGDALSRLLAHIKNQVPALFTPEQMKEISEMIQSMIPEAVKKKIEAKPQLEPALSFSSTTACGQSGNRVIAKLPKLEPSLIPRVRADFRLLLDPHVNHDEDSLPSPTRGDALPLPTPKANIAGPEAVISELTTWKREETEDPVHQPYELDGMTVTSYQQKHLHASFLCHKLPSPTPSGDCNDDDGDSQGEVSSSIANTARSVGTSVSLPHIASNSSIAHIENSSAQGLISGQLVGQMSIGIKPVAKSSAKNRDPRLRVANNETSTVVDLHKRPLSLGNSAARNGLTEVPTEKSRKQKVVDEFVLDNHAAKRQRNELSSPTDIQISSGNGGWLVDNGALVDQPSNRSQPLEERGIENRKLTKGEAGFGSGQDMNHTRANAANEQATATSSPAVLSLPSFLKDLAVNPTMFMHLINEQHRLAAEAQQKAVSSAPVAMQMPSTNRSPETILPVNSVASRVPDSDKKPDEKHQISSQTAPTIHTDAGRIRMKPRDPRRILHSSMVQKSENLGPDQLKGNGAHPAGIQRIKDSLTTREQGQQAQATSMSSQSSLLPDIARQFTKNLKSLANMISTSQVSSQTDPAPQNVSQTIVTRADEIDVRPVTSESNSQQTTLTLTPSGRIIASQSCNPWGNVDHLLDGYDDQQKAAIQMERARRIEEQSRMFAAKKLCLVLDLDHTLLNSAKFIEVDQVHEEILRKKEEQDREKPQRSLFRFPHMGMWTKLRPGIWNFLVKASQLYELHLYTMGNKLYATEMAKVLDPSGALFSGRVISKGDDGDPFDSDDRVPKSKDLDGVLGMESAVVIIDDSARVWPHHKLNLIVVERYTYFPCSRRQFGLPGPSLLEIDHDERLEDGTLASSLAVIERIHQNFFSHQCLSDVDVRNILASEQRKILSSCRIVFSRIFPVGEANPHMHPLWQTAEQFGAVCTNQIDDQVTHVVANSLGTDKVNWALSTGRFVVHPGWVEASALLYRRANEQDFAVKLQII